MGTPLVEKAKEWVSARGKWFVTDIWYTFYCNPHVLSGNIATQLLFVLQFPYYVQYFPKQVLQCDSASQSTWAEVVLGQVFAQIISHGLKSPDLN
jgi:hypothetical protein